MESESREQNTQEITAEALKKGEADWHLEQLQKNEELKEVFFQVMEILQKTYWKYIYIRLDRACRRNFIDIEHEASTICIRTSLQVARRFQPEKGVPLECFAFHVLRWQILGTKKSIAEGKRRRHRLTSLDEEMTSRNGRNERLENFIAEKFDPIQDFETREDLQKVLSVFTQRQKQVMKLRLQGCTFREIGDLLGISESRVSQIFTEIRDPFRFRLQQLGMI